MKIINTGFFRGVLVSIAATATIALGSTAVKNSGELAVHEQRLNTYQQEQQQLVPKLDTVSNKMSILSARIDVLNQRLNDQEKARGGQ